MAEGIAQQKRAAHMGRSVRYYLGEMSNHHPLPVIRVIAVLELVRCASVANFSVAVQDKNKKVAWREELKASGEREHAPSPKR